MTYIKRDLGEKISFSSETTIFSIFDSANAFNPIETRLFGNIIVPATDEPLN